MSGPDAPLPPYRYGIDPGPHPTRHPDGHSYRVGGAAGADLSSACARGRRLYAAGFFWEAHEAWEDAWRELPVDDPRRLFLQGLIQLTAARWKLARGEGRAARGLLGKAEERLARGVAGGGDVACGVHGAELLRRLHQVGSEDVELEAGDLTVAAIPPWTGPSE